MKLVFAPDTSDLPNWGCRVMGAWFRRALVKNATPPTWTAPCAWFMQPHPSLPRLETVGDFHRLAREVKEGRILAEVAAMLEQCDALLLNAENFIRPGALKGRMLLFLAYLATEAFGKPCVLTNHSLDLEEAALAELVREVYPRLDEVHCREEETARLCQGLIPADRLKRIPDVAFAVPAAPLGDWCEQGCRPGQFSAWPDSAEGFDPRRPYATVCASSIYALPQHRALQVAPAFVSLCRRLKAEVGQVLLAAPCDVDAAIMRQVQAATGYPLLGLHLPVRQAIDILGNAAVHIGGRWHASIFAATGGTPTVALAANSPKVHRLMRQLDQAGPVFDALRLGEQEDAIFAQACACLAAGPALRQRLRDRSRELAARVQGNLDRISALAARE